MEKNNERIYQEFERRNRQAELGGGEDKLRKRHEAGRMTARERIEMLLDKGTFVELDKFVTHRCTNYGMDRQKIPGDGIVSGYGKIDGRQVFVYAYDFTVFGGSLSITNANKIVKVQTMALKNGAPSSALNDSGGASIQEGVESLTRLFEHLFPKHDRFGCGAAALGHSRAVARAVRATRRRLPILSLWSGTKAICS